MATLHTLGFLLQNTKLVVITLPREICKYELVDTADSHCIQI